MNFNIVYTNDKLDIKINHVAVFNINIFIMTEEESKKKLYRKTIKYTGRQHFVHVFEINLAKQNKKIKYFA